MVRYHSHHERTPNDQRSDALNKNSPEYKAAMDNKSVQIQHNKESEESEE